MILAMDIYLYGQTKQPPLICTLNTLDLATADAERRLAVQYLGNTLLLYYKRVIIKVDYLGVISNNLELYSVQMK